MGSVGDGMERERRRGGRERAEVSEERGWGALSRQITRSIINGPRPRRANPGRKEKPLSSSQYRSPAQDWEEQVMIISTGSVTILEVTSSERRRHQVFGVQRETNAINELKKKK